MTNVERHIPGHAFAIRICGTGQVWWRIYHGRYEGLWTTDDTGYAADSVIGLMATEQLAALGAFEVVGD